MFNELMEALNVEAFNIATYGYEYFQKVTKEDVV